MQFLAIGFYFLLYWQNNFINCAVKPSELESVPINIKWVIVIIYSRITQTSKSLIRYYSCLILAPRVGCILSAAFYFKPQAVNSRLINRFVKKLILIIWKSGGIILSRLGNHFPSGHLLIGNGWIQGDDIAS